MVEPTSHENRSGKTPPPRPEPNPLIGYRPEVSRPVFGSPQEWFRRIKRKKRDRAA